MFCLSVSGVQFLASKHFIIRFDSHWSLYVSGAAWWNWHQLAPQVDVAVMLSEGAVARIAQGSKTKAGNRVASDVTWSPCISMYYGVYHQGSRLHNVLYMSFIVCSFMFHSVFI